jgi:hypothetical protein
MEHYAGIDVSLDTVSVCVVDGAGKVLREAKVATEPEAGPVTAKVCRVATAVRNTRFVKSAGPDRQESLASRHHPTGMPSGEVSEGVPDTQSAAAWNSLTKLAFAALGHFAHLRGHWAI